MRYVTMTVALALSLAAGSLGAREPASTSGPERPANAPQRFDRTGEFQGFTEGGRLQVDALKFAVSPRTAAYDVEGSKIYVKGIREGSLVGLLTEPAGDRVAGRVVEIWVLPAGSGQLD